MTLEEGGACLGSAGQVNVMESPPVTRGVISRRGGEEVPAPQGSRGRTDQMKHDEPWREVSGGAVNPTGEPSSHAAGCRSSESRRDPSGVPTLPSWGPPLQKQVAGSDKPSREEKVVVVLCLTRICQGDLSRARVCLRACWCCACCTRVRVCVCCVCVCSCRPPPITL